MTFKVSSNPKHSLILTRKSFKTWKIFQQSIFAACSLYRQKTALAISPSFLFHYLLPVALITSLTCFQVWGSILTLAKTGTGLTRTLWRGHRRQQSVPPEQQKATGAEMSSTHHLEHRAHSSCVAHPARTSPTPVPRFLQCLSA